MKLELTLIRNSRAKILFE